MSNDNYTFYADKPESHCRKWDHDYWGDTIFAFELTHQEMFDLLVKCQVTNLDLQEEEKGWEIVILQDGHPIESLQKEALFAEASLIAQKRVTEYKAEQKRIQKENERKRLQAIEDSQKRMYESLKKKFEPSEDK